MRNKKKSPEEKAATKKAQNARAYAKKKEAGLVRVSLWIPAEIADKCADLDRIGVVFADSFESEKRLVSVLLENGRFSVIPYQPNLLETDGQ